MYQVVELYGDCEPWWLLDDWQEDRISQKVFETYTQALTFFEEKLQEYRALYSRERIEGATMAAFWEEQDQLWCEECGDFLQQYHSIVLLEEGEMVYDLDALPVEDIISLNPHCRMKSRAKRA